MTNGPACEPTPKLRAPQRTQDGEEISTVCFFCDDAFRVMELELVEPSLYLRIDPTASDRFAEAITSLLA